MSQELDLIARGVLHKLRIANAIDLHNARQDGNIILEVRHMQPAVRGLLANDAPSHVWPEGSAGEALVLQMAERALLNRMIEVLRNQATEPA